MWDPEKAAVNFHKHGVDFIEAASAFGDPHSLSKLDTTHSIDEERWLLLGYSAQGRLLVVAHTERTVRFESSTHVWPRRPSAKPMKKNPKPSVPNDEIQPEYDFRGGIRGKYAKQYREGTTIVVLDPDGAAKFKDSQAVNEALRTLLANQARR